MKISKKIVLSLLLVVALALPVLLVGCGVKEADIVGKYKVESLTMTMSTIKMEVTREQYEALEPGDSNYDMYNEYFDHMIYEFKADHTVVTYVDDEPHVHALTWSLDGDAIKLDYTPTSESDMMTSVEVTGEATYKDGVMTVTITEATISMTFTMKKV